MTILDEFADLPVRINAVADEVRSLEEQLKNARETRDRLIVEAVDEARVPQAQVARAAGLSQPHIIRILAKSSS